MSVKIHEAHCSRTSRSGWIKLSRGSANDEANTRVPPNLDRNITLLSHTAVIQTVSFPSLLGWIH